MSDATPGGEVRTRFVSGAAWMVAMRWLMRCLGLISTAILARLLAPEDFGLVALAMIVYGLLDTVASTGVDLAVIRRQETDDGLLNAAWSIQVIQGFAVAGLMLLAAPFAAPFFDEERVRWILQLFALAAALQGFRNIGTVAFRMQLDFAREFRFLLYQRLTTFVVTIALAFWLRDYRALVFGMATQIVAEVILSYTMHGYRPRFTFAGMGRIWQFSQWILASRLGTTVNEKISQLIVGKAFSTSALGIFGMGVELGTIFVNEIVMPMRRALFPNLSRLQGEPDFAPTCLTTVGTIALLSFPMGVGLHLVAEPLVIILIGYDWLEAIPVLRWAALMACFSAVIGILDMILLVANRPDLNTLRVWLEALLLVPLLYLVAKSGTIADVALARTVVIVPFLVLMVVFVSRVIEVRQLALYAHIWRPLVASAVMYASDRLLLEPFLQEASLPAPVDLVAHVGLGVLSYTAALALLSRGFSVEDSAEAAAFGYARNALGGLRRRFS